MKTYIQPDNSEDDDVLEMLIFWASGQIRDYTKRLFTVLPDTPVQEQRFLWFRGTRSMRLDDPLKDVTEIIAPINHTVDGEPYNYETTLQPGDYELVNRPQGTTLRLDFAGDGRFDVTGIWGWETIPGTIQQACTVTVDEWYRSNVITSVGTRAEGESEGRNIYLPREVQEMLQPWILDERVA